VTVQNQLAEVEDLAAERASRKEGEPAAADPAERRAGAERRKRPLTEDEIWARKNLRGRAGRPIADIANVLRILERHDDFKGRFKFNEMVNRVLDKGTVMIDWRVAEICAVVQERFIAGVEETVVTKALTIVANRTGISN